MRFIINFIVFGLIFYAIWYFFPDAFMKMVNGAGAVFGYLRDLVEVLIQKINEHRPHPSAAPTAALTYLFSSLFR